MWQNIIITNVNGFLLQGIIVVVDFCIIIKSLLLIFTFIRCSWVTIESFLDSCRRLSCKKLIREAMKSKYIINHNTIPSPPRAQVVVHAAVEVAAHVADGTGRPRTTCMAGRHLHLHDIMGMINQPVLILVQTTRVDLVLE